MIFTIPKNHPHIMYKKEKYFCNEKNLKMMKVIKIVSPKMGPVTIVCLLIGLCREGHSNSYVIFLTSCSQINLHGIMEVKVARLCLTPCDPMNYIVHEILKARILEWVAIPSYRESSQPRDQTQVSCIAGIRNQ